MKPLLKRLDQVAVAALAAASLLMIAGWWLSHGGWRGDLVDIERTAPLGYQFRVDPNTAGWPELAQLPKIGETLARRIVASREAEGPFAKPADLLRVDGIGPLTLARIRGYLLPLPGEPIVAEDARKNAAGS